MGKIQEFLACALMVLHHSGKDLAKGLRGHSSLLGAVDTQLEILRFEDQAKGIISLTKQKDGQDGIRHGFEMVEIEISSSSLGFDPVVSLAVQASDEAVNQASKRGKSNSGAGKNQRLEMSCLENIVKSKGTIKFIDGQQRMVANLEDWRLELRSRMGVDETSESKFKTAWSRAKKRLVESKEGGIKEKLVWLQHVEQAKNEF
jgi:hypothetical protein